MLERFELVVPLKRDGPDTPRYVEIPSTVVATWELERTTEVDIDINGSPGGRRRLRPHDPDRWRIQIPEAVCKELEIETDHRLRVGVRLAVHDISDELVRVLMYPTARERWDALTDAEQRRLRQDVREAQLPRTRWERAAAALGLDEPVPDALVSASKNRGLEPLRVEAHFPPDSPTARKAFSEALDFVAGILTKQILYESWKEVVREAGGDPATAKVPGGLMNEWTAEFRPELVREPSGKRSKRRREGDAS